MEEMHKLAVVAQNHLVNIVRLRSLVQDWDEYQIIPGETQGGRDGVQADNELLLHAQYQRVLC